MTTTLFSGSLAACLIVSSHAYAAYNASTTTFEGTDNSGINLTASTYGGVETLIFNMGTAGTGNYFDQASWTYAGNIQIGATGATETGLCLNNGHADKTDVFTGKVTGTGVLSKTGAGARLTVAFEGDATEYSGDIRLGSTATFTLRFGAGSAAPAGQSAVHGVSGTGDITFAESDKDTLVYHYGSATPVYITNRISTNEGATSKVVLQGGSSYVLTKDATVSALTLADNTILHLGTTGHSSATVLGALTMGAGAAVHVDNGSLEVVNASSLAGTYAVGSAGVLHLSRTVALDGALTVAQGGALSLGALSGFGEAGGGLQTPAEGENGFAAVNGKLSILTGSADKLRALTGTKVLLEGKNLELAGDGTVTISEVDHSAYYLRSGEKSLSSLLSESDNNLVRVEMGTGAKLVVDSGAVQGSYSVAADRSMALSELGNSTIAADTRIEHLSATQPISVAQGASLTIGSTAADFAGDINLNANSRLVFSADTPTDMTVGTIRAEGGGDDYNRAVLVGENVRLHAASLVNSWGMDALTVNGEMTIDGVLQYSTGSNPAGSNRITGSGAITAGSLNISNWSYYNTLDVQSLRVLGGSDITVRTTINGGTVELQGNVSTWSSGHLTVNGGHLLLGDEVSDAIYLGADVNLTAGEITLNGTGTLGTNLHQTGGALTINGDLTLRETLTVTGTVNLNGTLQSTTDALTSADFVYSDGVNGFREATSTVLSKGEGELSFNLGENARFLLNGEDCTSSLTTDASGNIVSRNVDYTTYYLNSGSKNLSDMLNASTGSVNRISMADGTAVKADTGNLQGSFSVASAQSLSVENGGLSSVMAGNVHIEQLSATGNLVADYNATLTIGSTAAANAGDICVSSGAHLNFESDTPAEMHVGTVRFERGGDNYERTMHVGEGVTLHADAVVNSWGMKSLTVDGSLNIDGTLELATGGNAEGTNRVTGSGAITAGGLNISNWSYYNTLDVRSLRVLGGTGISVRTTIDGGTVELQGNVSTWSSGHLTVNGGHLLLGDEVSDAIYLGADVNLTAGEITLNGTGTLGSNLHQTGGTLSINGDLTLRETLTASGTVNLSGTLQSTSDALTATHIAYTDGENGFLAQAATVLSKGEGELSFNLGENARFLLNGEDCTSSLTTDASGNIVSRNADYTTYYLNSGSKNLSDMLNASTGSVNRISMADGTAVKADTGNLQGSFSVASAQSLSVENGGLSSVMAGNVHIEQLSATGNMVADYNATLTIGSTAAANAGDICVSSGAHLNFESDTPAEMHVGTVRFERGGDNYERTMHVGEGVTLHADAVVNSWGMKSLTVDGSLNIDGTLELATSDNAEGTNRVTGSGAVTAGGLNISNCSSYNTLDVRSLRVLGGSDITVRTTIDGGTVELQGNVSTWSSGHLTVNGGHLLLGDEVSDAIHLGADVNLTAGEITLNGTGTLGSNLHQTGGALTINGDLTLRETLTASGTVNLNGTLQSTFDALTATHIAYTDGENGFREATSTVLSKGEGELIFNLGENARFLLNGEDCTSSLTTDASGNIVSHNVDHSTYYLNSGNKSLANMLSDSAGALSTVSMGSNTSLEVDADVSIAILHDETAALHFTTRQTGSRTFSRYGELSFDGIFGSYGAAIYNRGGTVTLRDNRFVTFCGNSVGYGGGAICHKGGTVTLSNNGTVSFSGNSSDSYGGAISSTDGSFMLSDNGAMSFSGNSSDTYGGAIYNNSFFTLSGNETVTFSENSASDWFKAIGAKGGAIYNDNRLFSLSNNGAVTFSGNSVAASVRVSSSTSYDVFEGGAICNANAATFEIKGNGAVTFSDNSATGHNRSSAIGGGSSAIGGAISNIRSTFTLSENESVTFSGNSVPDDRSFSCGGAIYNDGGKVTLSKNGAVSFIGNSSFDRGGALENFCGLVTLSSNESVTFSGNSSSDEGGAIWTFSDIKLINNGAVTFSGNTATLGGAICNSGFVELSGNETVIFSGNSVSSRGAAIWSDYLVVLRDNGNVVFEKNAEVNDGTYRLRSVYAEGYLEFSAKEGKSILFKDSVWVSDAEEPIAALHGCTVDLNVDSTGDIIFTGATTEADLREVKGGVDGTAEEIENSRNSLLDADVTLFAGSLQVRDGAHLTVKNLTVEEGAELVLHDGALSITGKSSLGAVSISGNSSLVVQDGANLMLSQAIENSGMLTLSLLGIINVDALEAEQTSPAVSGYINTVGAIGTSGFYGASVVECRVALTEGTGSMAATDALATYQGNFLSVGEKGIATGMVGDIDYSTYYLNGTDTISLKAILAEAPFAKVQMARGVLNVDEDVKTEIVHDEISALNFSAQQTGGKTFSGYGELRFDGIIDSAIYNDDGTFTLNGNGAVTFSGNTASSSYYFSKGGAIYNYGSNASFTLIDNETVTFSGNTASSSQAYGGAIYNKDGTFTLSGNGAVTFSGNTASSYYSSCSSYGGAIYNSATFTLSDNRAVTFSGNTSSSFSSSSSSYYSSYGGAIYNSDTFTLSDNGAVTFSGNTAYYSSSSRAYGGAIYNSGTFTLSDNGAVTFSGNTASSSYSSYGGAISNSGTFTLSGNGNVLFEKNAEITKGTYCLSSIYSKGTLNLSAAEGKSILFRDSVYAIGTVNLNEDGAGDIIFTGATTEADLQEVKGGVAGTATEIKNSRSSILNATVTLYGGTLQVRDGASLTVKNLTAANGATLVLHDASFTTTGNSTPAAVTVSGNSTITAQTGATLMLQQVLTNSGTLTIGGTLDVSALTLTSPSAAATYIDVNGYSGDNGFLQDGISGSVQVVNGGTVVSNNATIKHGALTLTLYSNGTATSGGTVDYGTYYINGGSASLAAIKAVASSAKVQMTGGCLTIDTNAATEILHDNTAALAITARQSRSYTGYGRIAFEGISYTSHGGAIGAHSFQSLSLDNNGALVFRNNSADGDGGAIYNDGSVSLSDNGVVTFAGNRATSHGGAIYNYGTLTLRGNGDVLFEKNAEIENGTYRMRSIYSRWGTLNLSASEGKSILFKDSVYARGSVNLNQDGTGDIIFSGATTEADLREVKGGIDGTAQEILNSRTSEIATNASLYGGRLIVEDGAILKGQGITFTEGADATIRLNGGTLDETGYAIAVSSGSGLEFEGDNVLKTASVQMDDGAFLSFVMGEDSGTNWDAQLITGQLHVQVSGDLFSEHRLLTLADASQYDTSRWTSDAVTVRGAGFDSLSWADGVLRYTPHVITPDADGTLDDLLPDDGNAIIDGNGHTLSVKDEVQLVQLALNDGIVKLEGANNNIGSATLTEGGELVLAAGAGLTTGDIISMVASGKDELVISGNITLDDKGMKGKAGEQATLSHVNAQVLGDATISNVRMEESTIDLAKDSTVNFTNVVLSASAMVTDDPATLVLDDVTAELELGVNVCFTESDMLAAGTQMEQSGNMGAGQTLAAESSVVMLETTTFDSVTLTGSSLVLELAGMEVEIYNSTEWIGISFTSGTDYATFDPSLAVTLSIDGVCYESGYTIAGDDDPTTMYFRGGKELSTTPEPATATLSLLALAVLAARRKRK